MTARRRTGGAPCPAGDYFNRPRLKSCTRRLTAEAGFVASIGYSCPAPTANKRSGLIAKVVDSASLIALARSSLNCRLCFASPVELVCPTIRKEYRARLG